MVMMMENNTWISVAVGVMNIFYVECRFNNILNHRYLLTLLLLSFCCDFADCTELLD